VQSLYLWINFTTIIIILNKIIMIGKFCKSLIIVYRSRR